MCCLSACHWTFRWLALPLALLVLAGCSQPDKASPEATPQVGVYVVKTRALGITTTLPGRVSASMTSPVRPQVDGIIRKRLFAEGSQVKAGQVLYRIDPSRYRAAYDSAKASLAQAQAKISSSRAKAQRYRKLAKINAVSKQQRDEAAAQLAQNKADVATAEANLEAARINLGYTRVKAPISGRIDGSNVTPGALVTANQPAALATIRQLDPIYVDINQTSTQYLQFKRALTSGRLAAVGKNAARVRVSLEGGKTAPMTGRLEFASASVDPGTGTVRLRAILPNPNAELLPGMYVRATIDEGVDENAILVPQQGVSRTGRGQATCLLVNDQGKIEPRALRIAAAEGHRWRVAAGLAAGDRVVVQGNSKVSPGDKVKAVAVTIKDDGEVVATGQPAPGKEAGRGRRGS